MLGFVCLRSGTTAGMLCGGLSAQAFQAKAVRYVIAYSAGVSNDIVGRLVIDWLARTRGQRVIVETPGGASGEIAMAVVAKAQPDGYTLSRCNIAPIAIFVRHRGESAR